MASKPRLSLKQLQIDKATATMLALIVTTTVVFTASLVLSRALLSQRAYQARVIAKKEKAKQQLTQNLKATESLVASYQQFVSSSENVIGGNPAGEGENDGDNARIILDALPSKYDFPALITSLEKILSKDGLNLRIEGITGTDDEIAQGQVAETAPVAMPFQVTTSGSYDSIQGLVSEFEHSIRPFHFQVLTLSGSDNAMRLDLSARTYYQPEKKINIQLQDVR